jgi:DNA-binding NtrC family response regulator
MDPDGVGETATLAASRATRGNRAYLLVVEDGSSRMYPLPSPGVVTVGRAPESELRIDHSSVSRRHARILVERGELRISDLDSHNGTRVNGMLIDGVRVLATGDVIAIGEVLLVVHAELERAPPYTILDDRSWRQRLAEEVERAVTFHRPVAVLAIVGGPPGIHHLLRSIDVVGGYDGNELLALLPEADPVTAQQLAAAVIEGMRSVAPEVRIGIAGCPRDATDPDNLVLAARAAVAVAEPGKMATPLEAARWITLGERRVLVCHPAIVRVFALLERLANADLPVLIIGETGVGKENAAYAVHHYSERRNKPFVALNCAALPDSLVESQLFGHDRGAFTGATSARPGLLEAASGGTLFLDEIGELALPVQAKLLRALETRRITRVGETTERDVDIRIVAATHRVLEHEVKAQRFREDLYFRLGAARVHVLPLRDRRCEIPMLFREFVAQAAKRARRVAPEPVPLVMQQLLSHDWPGNVRELKNVAEFATTVGDDDRIEPEDLPAEFARGVSSQAALEAATACSGSPRRLADEVEQLVRQRMVEALARHEGVKRRAASAIGMPLRTFNLKVRQYGL